MNETTDPEGQNEQQITATQLVGAGGDKKSSLKKFRKTQQDLDENAADEEDNEVLVAGTPADPGDEDEEEKEDEEDEEDDEE